MDVCRDGNDGVEILGWIYWVRGGIGMDVYRDGYDGVEMLRWICWVRDDVLEALGWTCVEMEMMGLNYLDGVEKMNLPIYKCWIDDRRTGMKIVVGEAFWDGRIEMEMIGWKCHDEGNRMDSMGWGSYDKSV